MSVVVSEAKRVGRYIEKLATAIGNEREMLSSDLVKNPDKVMEIVSSLPAHNLIHLFVFLNFNFALFLKEIGEEREAENLVNMLVEYLEGLKTLTHELEKPLLEWRRIHAR